MDAHFRISVIIPVKNEQKNIKKCLEGVYNQTISPCEVIIVDGGSTDKTVEYAKFFPVKVVFEDYGTVGGARQVGLINAQGEFIAYTDADCIPDRAWLENLSKGLAEGIMAVGGSVVNRGNGTWEESIALALNTFFGGARSVQERVYPDKRYVKSVSGCNCIYRKSDLLKVGGFNTKLKINEDTIINKKLRTSGKIIYVPDAVVHHYQNRNIWQFIKRMYFFGYGRGKNRLIDLQVVPPVLAVVAVAFLLLYYPLFLFMICLYIAIVAIFTVSIFMRSRKPVYLLSVPAVYLLEHVAYAAGFWAGTLRSLAGQDEKVYPRAE